MILILAATASSHAAPLWIEQLGTASYDVSLGVSADSLGNVYISGYTDGNLGGPNAGGRDAFLAKYNAAGTLQWTEQLGTSSRDISYGVSADSLGNVYISGFTEGSLGGPNAGGDDAFLAKYDATGSLLWTEQIGTVDDEYGWGVSADSLGNVYISGYTEGSLAGPHAGGTFDAFLAKYDTAGTLQWTEQLGTSSRDFSYAVSADSLGSVYISGWTEGSLGGPNVGSDDAFLAKYNAEGSLQWSQQLGTSLDDETFGVSADSLGNVYISGHTLGNLGGPNVGDFDVFLAKYDDAGMLLWTEQLGSSDMDESFSVSADSLGNVYISGNTFGDLGGPNTTFINAFVAKYDAAGTLQWTEKLEASFDDESLGVSADSLGNVYVSGLTGGSLGGPNAGGADAFVAKYGVPEPSSLVLAAFGFAALVARCRRRGW